MGEPASPQGTEERDDGTGWMQQAAPAKINLGLHVLHKRPDGYHDIETILIRIPWTDTISVRPAEEITMDCTDPSLPTDDRNLCMEAAHRLLRNAPEERGAHLHLAKHVPAGAGLGGGSSDAAATLQLLAELWDLELSSEQLQAVAAELGSDVPFFMGEGAAYASGRGEQLEPLRVQGRSYRLPYALVVAVPPVHVSTPEAYGWVEPHAADRPDLRSVVASNDLARWRRELANDFEEPVLARHPSIRAVREQLVAAGAGYAALSGSGAAVFGVFEEAEAAEVAARACKERELVRAVQAFPAPGIAG